MKFFFLVLALVLASCSSSSWKPGPYRSEISGISRGWSFVESEHDFLAQDTGVSQVSYSGVVLAGEKLIFGSDRFGVVAVSKRNGQVLWRKKISDGVGALPLVVQSKVYIGSDAGELFLLDTESGKEIWKTQFDAPVHGSMIIAADRLFASTSDDAVHAIDPTSGKILWKYRRPPFGGSRVQGGGHPTFINGSIWMGFSDGSLVSLDPNDGQVKFEKQYKDGVKFFDLDAKVIGWRDGILITTFDGKLRYMRPDGAIVWEFNAGGARAVTLGDDDKIFLPSSDGSVYAINGRDGKEIWRYPLRRGVPSGMALLKYKSEKVLVFSTTDERVYALDPKTGKLLSQSGFGRNSGSYSPLVVDDDTKSFFVLSSFSRVYQFKFN